MLGINLISYLLYILNFALHQKLVILYQPLTDLCIYDDSRRYTAIAERVASSHCSNATAAVTEQSKSACDWVQATLATYLAIVSLLTSQNVKSSTLLPQRSSSTP
ncbi:hypothetical protein Nepgr_006458 [Nepenthes gracilis]|uniref:DUF6857 domain-containing protein n=1 Tax=Nepenthes gracilis TaxID=150966 RepID=A0AAD3XHE2_NEPGR|nr:hypothetical protein Nepgr_006458 [Nepenthes gracilis]